ncbi:hypothetical protein QR77_27970 [Streptomyces sp. 150FB]|uniref:DUF3626 domain-containing protein n=1 Tax=Streptomyces sp. 150FB TaxID=1576605 RepID=UPI0005896344|nr:DUF3626 domain-containing protein [Streptomyces sp. 150FB]KIF76668.1 hypothetical protein QR77_27970 [Streptomyces sp. 150FB]
MNSLRTALTTAQHAALCHLRARGAAGYEDAVARIGASTRKAADQRHERGIGERAGREAADALVSLVGDHARITLNFHPDRLLADGLTVAESLSLDGRYRSQYETGLSNGSRTAVPGGLRDDWELALFGGAYHADGVRASDRPKYGALNVYAHPDGASPRFGSCHVRLRPEVSHRSTFCHGGSQEGPADVGTIDAFACVLAGLLEEDPCAADIVGQLPYAAPGAVPGHLNGRKLDEFVEAQVHGDIDLAADAEALVLDPSFRDTETGRLLTALARRCGIEVEWHAGFVLAPEEVDAEFRGPVMVPLAARICSSYAPTGMLDAEVLGHAAASAVREPEAWADWGTRDEVLQYVKQLWHVLVRYGHPGPTSV